MAEEAPARPPAEPSNLDPDRYAELPRLLVYDARQVLGSRQHWDSSDWTLAWAGGAVILGTALLLDRPADKALENQGTRAGWNRAAKAMEPFGSVAGVGIAATLYLAGPLFGPEVRSTGTDAVVAIAIAELGITLPLKELVGRARPVDNQGTHSFRPFGGGQSFPSGHTTVAFALASVVSEHADRVWVSCTAYGIAGLVGLARVEERNHFLSDVVAGGLIGTFVGRVVFDRNQILRGKGSSKLVVAFSPVLMAGGAGLSLSAKF